MRLAPFIVALLLALVAPRAVQGEVSVSFPLGDHYRVGRYLPVHVTGRLPDANATVRMEVAGAVPVELDATGLQVNATVPLLAVTTLAAPRWSLDGVAHPIEHALRPLGDDERLVGATEPDDVLAAELFPGKRVHTVRLGLTDPLPGPAVAWGALDAVLLDAASAARLSEKQAMLMLAAGTAVAIRSDSRPGGGWPWERHGGWWVARIALAGPKDVIEADAYLPVMGEAPGWPAPFRRNVVLILAAFSIAALAASLWRSRRYWAVVVAVSAVAAAALAVHRFAQFPVRAVGGGVCVEADGYEQRDEWVYRTALQPINAAHRATDPWGLQMPVFSSRRHFEGAGVQLECWSDGAPQVYRYALPRRGTIAFVSRKIITRDRSSLSAMPPEGSPLLPLVQRMYLTSADRIAGVRPTETSDAIETPQLWPDLVIERRITPTPASATSPAAPPR